MDFQLQYGLHVLLKAGKESKNFFNIFGVAMIKNSTKWMKGQTILDIINYLTPLPKEMKRDKQNKLGILTLFKL